MAKVPTPAQENEQYLHEYLTEDSIRHVALRFLKTYYKYRPRKGETTLGKNLTTASGIIVDGYLSFQTPDNRPFLATLEASSYSKRGEVKYRLQSRILFWDAMATGSLAGLLLFSYGYAYNHFTVEQLGLWKSLGIVLGTILAFFLLFRLISKGFSRYRYIYAVEQFKRYAADEQWIAIGEDVFGSSNDKRFAELKKQCVYNGFGLLVADKNFEPHLLITPARKVVLTGRRQIFKVLSDNRLRERMRNSLPEKQWTKVKAFFGKISDKSPIKTRSLLRYQRKFWRQAAVVVISFALLGNILYRELKDANIFFTDNKVYLDEKYRPVSNTRPEPNEYLVDSTAINEPFRSDENVYDQNLADLRDDKYIEEIDERGGTVDYQTNRLPRSGVTKTEEVAVFVDGSFLYYDCTRFFGFSGRKYIVTDGLYGNLRAAEGRIRQLARLNISAHAFWVGCFDKAQGYVVYYGEIYNERTTADRASAAFSDAFRGSKIKRGEAGIMVLER